MVKHTQTIRREFADKLSVFDHFVGLALKRLKDSSGERNMRLNGGQIFLKKNLIMANI